jgi:hypothetical protein
MKQKQIIKIFFGIVLLLSGNLISMQPDQLPQDESPGANGPTRIDAENSTNPSPLVGPSHFYDPY